MRVALIQMPVLPDKGKNIQTACGKIREAAKNGADFAVLPEIGLTSLACLVTGVLCCKLAERRRAPGALL